MSESLEDPAEKIQRLLQENKDLKSFAFLVCHDLQAPLRHISLYIDNLQSSLEGTGFLENTGNTYALSVIKSGAQKMTSLIDNLMTLSNVEKRPLHMEEVNLNSLCAKVVVVVLEGLPDSITCNVKWGHLPTVRGDKEELFQVMMNLCSNGVKFRAQDNPPEIEISVVETGNFWEVAVADNGMGVDHDERETIFLPFKRLRTTEDFPGTGLGLSICQKIVRRHGGELWVTSKSDGGSIFHFTIAKDLVASPRAED